MAIVGGIAASAAGSIGGAALGDYVHSKTGGKGSIGSGGGGGSSTSVPQIDISKALIWFDEAAQKQDKYARAGLDYYNNALEDAAKQIQAGYKDANKTLQPLSFASNAALNEQLRFLGITPISPSRNFAEDITAVGNYPDLQRAFQDAERISDPAQRAQVKDQLMQQIISKQQAIPEMSQELKDQQALYESVKGFSPKTIDVTGKLKGKSFGTNDVAIINRLNELYGDNAADADTNYRAEQAAGRIANIKKNYEASLADYNKQVEQVKATNESLANLSSQYGLLYDTGYNPSAYTGDEVTAKIESTPGYQFQVGQGQKAIERSASAKGMLNSGNTLLAVQGYGQQLGQSYYNTYMDNLSKVVAEGSGATFQISQNQANQGTQLGQLRVMSGQAGMDTERYIGDAYANSLYQQGYLYSQAATANAGLQQQAIQGAAGRQSQLQQQQLSSGPAYMNAQTGQNALNYSIFQGQQGGQAASGLSQFMANDAASFGIKV